MARDPDEKPHWREYVPTTRSRLASGLVVVAIVLTFASGSVDSRGGRAALLIASLVLIVVSIGVFAQATRAARREQRP